MKNLYIILIIVGVIFVSSAQAATILFPSGGGTGTSTAPTYGQLLVGNVGGTYTLTATSSLGITAASDGVGNWFTPQADGNATSTELIFKGGFLSTASSTINANLYISGTNALLIGTTSQSQSVLLGVNGAGFFNGSVYAPNFVDTALTGTGCVGETSGLLTTSNCVSSIASANSSITVSSPTGNVDISLTSRNINGTAFNGTSNITITAASSTLLGDVNTFSTAATTTFSGNVYVVGNLQVDGQFFAPVTLVASGDTTINGALTVTGTVDFDTYTSAILLTGAGGIIAEYTGASCTNQFVRSLSALGAATCATVVAGDVDLADLTATNATLTFSGAYDGSTARTIGLNLGTSNAWTALQTFTNASSTQFTAGTDTFYINSAGRIQAKDTTNGWSGVVSPTHSFVLGTGTTTTWTSSTTNSAYSPFIQMPFTGTLRQVRCGTDASFVGVNMQVNGSNATPGYFIASSTIGVVAFTAGNTFSVGQKILANFGTTTTSSTKSINCTFDVTETL